MTGTSYTYFTTDNAKSARELVGILREAKAVIPPQLEEMTMFGGGGGRGQYPIDLVFADASAHHSSVGRFNSRGRGGGGGGGRYGGGGGGGGYGGGGDYGSRDRW